MEDRLTSWPGVYRDDDGHLVGIWGLAAEAVSEHRVAAVGGGSAWAWCALDPLFILPAIGATAEVTSRCPTRGADIRLTVAPTLITSLEPSSSVVSFLVPDHPFAADVRETFCHFVNFFSSPAAADEWVTAHPDTFWVPVEDAAEVGRRLARQTLASAWG